MSSSSSSATSSSVSGFNSPMETAVRTHLRRILYEKDHLESLQTLFLMPIPLEIYNKYRVKRIICVIKATKKTKQVIEQLESKIIKMRSADKKKKMEQEKEKKNQEPAAKRQKKEESKNQSIRG
uniref:Uncharacterized protein n=1 Tax=Caenorhabditis tropicalis TaxID=1561998 RepID=A0A1I7U329_9PELO